MERTRTGEVGIEEPRTEKIRQPKGEREDDAGVSKVSKVRVLLGALVVLVLAAFAAGCGPDSDQGQARQEATKNIEAKGQQARQTAKKKVEAKKQEVKEKVEALQKQVDDLQKDVQDLQKKINAQEQKDQQQQINQLKKALNNLKKKVEAQEQRGQ
jgi:TolA-binding protein